MLISIILFMLFIIVLIYFADEIDDWLFNYYHKDDRSVKYNFDDILENKYKYNYGFLEYLFEPFLILHERISYRWFRIKMFLQRIFRGWSDEEIWALSGFASEYILKRILIFKERYGSSLPMHYNENRFLTEEEWNEILDEMIYYLLCVEGEITIDNERFDKASILFAKYFPMLID